MTLRRDQGDGPCPHGRVAVSRPTLEEARATERGKPALVGSRRGPGTITDDRARGCGPILGRRPGPSKSVRTPANQGPMSPAGRMKNLARRVLRPLARPIKRLAGPAIRRLHFRVVYWTHEATDARFENLEFQVAATRADVDGLARYVPAVLNTIASQNAMNRANVRTEEELARLVRSVLERFESVRNELVSGRAAHGLDALFEPKVLHPERIEAAGGDLRLNLACGQETPTGLHQRRRAALRCRRRLGRPRDLPFDAESVTEIRVGRLLERSALEEIERALLPHWVSLLRPGGLLVAVVPDGDAMVRAYVAGDLSFDELRDRDLR